MEKTNHHLVLYGLLVLVIACVLFLARQSLTNNTEGGQWQCTTFSCVAFISPETWIAQNCLADASTGNQSCRLFINGLEQLVPLEAINTTYLSQQCETYVCTEETFTREVNYTINVDTSSLQVQ